MPKRSEQTDIDDAIAALQPFYEAGEDGYPVSLALDALAGILGRKARIDVEDEEALGLLLEELDASDELIKDVAKLYKNAAGGEYGTGLSRKQAKLVNDLVQEVVEPLVEFITGYRRPKVPSSRTRKQTKRRHR